MAAERRRRGSLLRTFGPLGVLTVLACALFAGSLVVGAQHIDDAERRREEALVRDDVARRIPEIEATLNPFVIWDEAYDHLSSFDRGWADKNIARSVARNLGFGEVATLDGAGAPQFAADARGELPAERAAALRAAAAPLVTRVRALGADARARRRLHSIQASRLALLDGAPALVTASLVRHEDPADDSGALAPVLLTSLPIDRAFVLPAAGRFHLEDARAEIGGMRAPHAAAVPLAQDAGRGEVRLAWRPTRPGAQLLGRSIPFLLFAVLTIVGGATVLVLHARRINRSLLRSKERATHLAYHDPLTGLGNRALLSERLDLTRRAMRRGDGSYAVLCLDLDRFKEVNDTYGHDAGDELIQEVSERLQAICRAGDVIVRLGGDEFAVIQSPAAPPDAAALAERIVKSVSGQVELPSGRAMLSCSVGVAVVEDPALGQMEALRQADLALYRAKGQGKGRYCFFEPEMDAALKAKKSLEDDLRQAVADEAIQVAYQPIVRADGRIIAVEALARWTHPVRGAVSPAAFIPLAEECGLISDIGGQVFRRACLDFAAWPSVRLSLNVSPVQMRRPGFSERVRAGLTQTGADPRRIDVEITEGVLLTDEPGTHAILDDLRTLGFQFALDDFGTGYSSLSYLHRYPVQKIKLDRAFVVGLGEGARAKSIVRALVQLARALDLKVIAEGVETEEQLKQLIACGCDLFQGFLFSRPAPAEEIGRMLSGAPARPAASRPPAPITAA